MTERTDWVDYGKGIGIILVVYSHLLSSAFHDGINIPAHFFALSDSIVYSFHMPFFFFLSGLFVETSFAKRGARAFLSDKLSRLVYPYFVWSILQMSVEVVYSSHTQNGTRISDILAIPYRPWGQFWFIYALVLMYIAYTIFSRFGRYASVMLFITAVGLYFFPLSIGFFALPDFCIHLIFFTGGILSSRYLLNGRTLNIPLWAVILLCATLVGSGYYVFKYVIEPIRLAGSSHPFYYLFLSVLGIAACISLSQYLSTRGVFGFLKTLGVYSLQIYLVHMLAGAGTRYILVNFFHIENWLFLVTAGVLVALTTPIALQLISMKLNFPYLFEFRRKNNTLLK